MSMTNAYLLDDAGCIIGSVTWSILSVTRRRCADLLRTRYFWREVGCLKKIGARDIRSSRYAARASHRRDLSLFFRLGPTLHAALAAAKPSLPSGIATFCRRSRLPIRGVPRGLRIRFSRYWSTLESRSSVRMKNPPARDKSEQQLENFPSPIIFQAM